MSINNKYQRGCGEKGTSIKPGIQTGTANMENTMEFLLKKKQK